MSVEETISLSYLEFVFDEDKENVNRHIKFHSSGIQRLNYEKKKVVINRKPISLLKAVINMNVPRNKIFA